MDVESVNGKANAGLTTGIIGTALAALGGLGGVAMMNGAGYRTGSEGGRFITKDELDMSMKLSQKDSEIAILSSEKYGDQKLADVYERIMTRVNSDQRAQAEWNASQSVANAQMSAAIATNAASISSLQNCCNQITKIVVPNTSVCPGWGNVTITPAAATSGTN